MQACLNYYLTCKFWGGHPHVIYSRPIFEILHSGIARQRAGQIQLRRFSRVKGLVETAGESDAIAFALCVLFNCKVDEFCRSDFYYCFTLVFFNSSFAKIQHMPSKFRSQNILLRLIAQYATQDCLLKSVRYSTAKSYYHLHIGQHLQ